MYGLGFNDRNRIKNSQITIHRLTFFFWSGLEEHLKPVYGNEERKIFKNNHQSKGGL